MTDYSQQSFDILEKKGKKKRFEKQDETRILNRTFCLLRILRSRNINILMCYLFVADSLHLFQ